MQPSLIRSTANSALDLLELRGRGSTEAFLLSWVAWEGLKVRLVVVGLNMQGWQVSDVYAGLTDGRVHTNQNYLALFRTIYGRNPHNVSGVGDTWRQIEEFREVRNRYVHGTRGAAPAKLEAATLMITERVLDPSWLRGTPIKTEEGMSKLGDPYRRLVASRARHRSKASLKEMLVNAVTR